MYAVYARLLQTAFPKSTAFSDAALEWRYGANPVGLVVGHDAFAHDGSIAAHYVTVPVRLRAGEAVHHGLLSLNTATHPEHQGRKLFTRLAQATYDQAASAGHAFVIGVANANSTPGFRDKLGFEVVGPLAAGVMLSAPRRLKPVDGAWATDWDETLLRWRLANPAGHYRLMRSGEIVSCLTPTGLASLSCGAFLPAASAAGLSAVAGRPRLPFIFIGSQMPFDHRRCGFIPIPDRLRPSPLNLIYKPLLPSAPRRAPPIEMTYLDFDAY
jgi:GNAT superfamily N-acetyltransferase